MTNTTTNLKADRLQRRRSPFWWLWPLSCAVHVVLFGALIANKVFSTEMTFDREQFTKQTEEAEKKAKQRAERERLQRTNRALSRDHQRQLKKEVERRPRLEMIERIKTLERIRQEIEIAKAQELEHVEQRTEQDYRQKLLEQIVAIAETIEIRSLQTHRNSGLFMFYDQITLMKAATKIPEESEERRMLDVLDELIKKSGRRLGNGREYPLESIEKVNAAIGRVEQALKQQPPGMELSEQIAALRHSTRRHTASWPIFDGGSEAVLKAKGLRQAPDEREIAVELIGLASTLATRTKEWVGVKRYPPVALYEAALELEKKVREFLGDPPDLKEFNDVSVARRPPDPQTTESRLAEAELRKASAKQLYETARKLEQEIEQDFNDNVAADLALQNNTSFNDAVDAAGQRMEMQRTDLTPTLEQTQPRTIGEMNAYRDSVNAASDQVESMTRRGRFLLSQVTGEFESDSEDGKAFVEAVNSGSSDGQGPGDGSLFDSIEGEGGAHMGRRKVQPSVRLRLGGANVTANVLPGRRFSRNTPRTGWLYVDTWYLIGPWENHGRIDYTNVHPPETEINFDAAYTDGKLGMSQTAARRLRNLDGALRWRFTQSDTMRIRPRYQAQDATFYAYTELYFEEPKELLVGSPADDCVRVWINDEIVCDNKGLAQWSFNQGFYPVRFQQGTNRVLVRLENGPGEVQFTFILVPPELAAQ